MSDEFKFTDPGEGLHEAEIIEVHVADGDEVADGDTLFTIETDKASIEIPSPFDGTIDSIKIAAGDTVEVGDVLLTYTDGDTSDADEEDTQDKDKNKDKDKDSSEDDDDNAGDEYEEEQDESDADDDAAHDDAPEKSGDEHPDKEKDDDHDSKGHDKNEKTGQPHHHQGKKDGESTPVPAAPSTRRLAREKNVDLATIKPSGKHGRVTAEDVEAAASGQKSGQGKQASSELPDFSQWGETEREPLRSIRRATARSMAQSWSEIPHVYHQDIADITMLEDFRQAHKPEHGKLTITVLVMKALVATLKRFPRFNASLDMENEEIILKHYFHIGLAVATERGLLVPVIRDVDRKSLSELAVETIDMARKARNGELSLEDMSGASMTVTNPGPMGGSSLTPLINPPQVAILGMARARLEPVVIGDIDNNEFAACLRLPLILGFDHRVNDGADAARFVTALIELLADPEALLMAI